MLGGVDASAFCNGNWPGVGDSVSPEASLELPGDAQAAALAAATRFRFAAALL